MRKIYRDYVFSGSRILGLSAPTVDDESANKAYVDDVIAAHTADPNAHGDFLTEAEASLLYAPLGGGTHYVKSAEWYMSDGSEIVVTSPMASAVRTLQDNGNVVRWAISVEGGPGSCEIDVRACAFASGPPTAAHSITGGNNPELVSAVQDDDTTLTSWTTVVSAGWQIVFVLLSASNCTKISITLEVERT